MSCCNTLTAKVGGRANPFTAGREHPDNVRIHLDTDFGGDTDDACALAMLLGWRGVELTGITTVADRGGQRAAYVKHVLRLVGREDIPVVAGAALSLTTLATADPVLGDERHWPVDIAPSPSPPGAALELLRRSLDTGATIVAIGPYTNLAMLEVARAGSLAQQSVVVMGGWVEPPAAGLPQWDRTRTSMCSGIREPLKSSRPLPN
jgi:purine nucleosidase